MSELKVKTFDGWHKYAEKTGKHSYEDYAQPGDKIDRETYDYFMNCLPPATMGYGYFQMGEEHDYREVDGKMRATYMTFLHEGGDSYFYLGDLPAGYTREPDGKIRRLLLKC